MQSGLEILKTVVDAHGIRFRIFRDSADGRSIEGIEDFDDGLRRQLYKNYDYHFIAHQIREECHEHCLYMGEDAFGLRYTLFWLRDTDTGAMRYITVGPYMQEGSEPDAMEVVERMGLDLYHVQILHAFYSGMGILQQFERVLLSLLNALFPLKHWTVSAIELGGLEGQSDVQLRIRDEQRVPMQIVEERYRLENRMLEAVEHGDEAGAMLVSLEMGKISMEKRSSDSLRNDKNSLLILNVLLRKAVERAGVHPWYIDELSSLLARRIEAARTGHDIMRINQEFVRRYCLLVQNYSRKGYCEIVEKSINYIELNLQEELRLGDLAAYLNVNPSYLSARFKKETGMTLTDYVNEKRIRSSLALLTTTRLPIGEVAEMVGILNENYYSRLFKKLQGMSPREYRSRMTESVLNQQKTK